MIFYSNQLMKSRRELLLYLVSNPRSFTRFEDHEAALQIRLHELVEKAIEEKEDPVALIQECLQVEYNGGSGEEDIANFLINSHQMIYAMHHLKDSWKDFDGKKTETDSLVYGSATTREQAVETFAEITLRSYLEALSEVYEQ